MKHVSFLQSPLFIGIAFVCSIVALGLSSSLVIQKVRANADYICTHIVEESSGCSNGTWSNWQTISNSDNAATCTTTTVQQRIYTGTRVIRHILTYLNLRTACNADYTQQRNGDGGGASGFHGGTIVTESSACQITETQTAYSVTNSATSTTNPACRNVVLPETHTTSNAIDTSGAAQDSQNVSSIAQLDAFRASKIDATIKVFPYLVKKGDATQVTWQSVETTSCSVTATNGDGTWTGTSGEHASSPITAETIYTLHCTAFNGTPIERTAKVSIVPDWQEN